MPRTRQLPVEDDETDNPLSAAVAMPITGSVVNPPENSDEELTPADRVALMLNDVIGDDRAYLNVYKMNADEQYAFCDKIQPAAFETGGLGMIRKRFGAGKFQVRLYGTQPGSNRFVVRGRMNVEIMPIFDEVSAPAPLQVNQTNDLGAILHAMSEQNRLVLEALQNRPQVDPMANMRETLTMMTLMREAMGISGQSQQKSSIGEIVDAIRELKGAKSLIDGDEDKEPSMMQLGSQVLGLIQNGQQSQQVAPVQIPPTLRQSSRPPVSLQNPVAAQPAQNPVQTGDGDRLPTEEEKQMFFNTLNQLLNTVVQMAQQGKPAEEAAELLYEKLPDQIIDMVDDPSWFQMLGKFAPQLNAHEAWTKEVHSKLLEILAEEEGPEDDSTTGNGEHDNGVSPNGH